MRVEKQDNRLKILIAVTVITLVVALGVVGAIVISELISGANGDTGERLNGNYTISVSSGTFAGTGGYSFDGSNKVIETYTEGAEIVTNEYTYIITKEGDTKYIVLTAIDGDNAGKTTKHELYSGTLTDENGVVNEFISINETYYYKADN
jgi:hypothetical protein